MNPKEIARHIQQIANNNREIAAALDELSRQLNCEASKRNVMLRAIAAGKFDPETETGLQQHLQDLPRTGAALQETTHLLSLASQSANCLTLVCDRLSILSEAIFEDSK